MSDILRNFVDGETIPISATTSSASQAFALPASWNSEDVMIYNETSVTAFVAFDADSATAVLPGTTGTINATPIPAGALVLLTKNKTAKKCNTCAVILRSGSGNVYFTAGAGN